MISAALRLCGTALQPKGFALAVVACWATACSGKPPAERPPSGEAAIAQAVLRNARWVDVPGADLTRGMQIVIGTAPCARESSCYSCFQCHGVRGEGSALARIPRLAGQSYFYLQQELQNYASGRRRNAAMQAVASRLSEQQMRDAAAYYAAAVQGWPSMPANILSDATVEDGLATAGLELATRGDAARGVQACGECHGLAGGTPATPLYPQLSGQHAEYIEDQLQAFRRGVRPGSLNVMPFVASRMDEAQIRAVALYYSSAAPASAHPAPSAALQRRASTP